MIDTVTTPQTPRRRIVLKPEPDLARRIDGAARQSRQSAPQWIFSVLERVLVVRADEPAGTVQPIERAG
jgi:hypothetical protein